MSERSLGEILRAAKGGSKPTHDECYFAMLALDGLSTFTTTALRNAGLREKHQRPERLRVEAEEDFRRWKMALNKPPREWLGPSGTPGTPEHDSRRRLASAVWKNVIGEEL